MNRIALLPVVLCLVLPTVAYTTAGGETVTTQERVQMNAESLREDVGIEATVVEGNETTVARRALDPIPAESTRTVQVNVSTIDETATAIPIRIEYLSDGIRENTVYEVPIDDLQPADPSPATGGPSPLVFFGGGLVVLAVLATGGYLYLRR